LKYSLLLYKTVLKNSRDYFQNKHTYFRYSAVKIKKKKGKKVQKGKKTLIQRKKKNVFIRRSLTIN